MTEAEANRDVTDCYGDDTGCANCDGEGFTFGCSWDWQCETYDAGEGTCLCIRNCDWCNAPKLTPETEALRQIIGNALAGKEPQ
jgi:hypothetical protein